MNRPELDKIFACQNAVIIAPAGHGKTEMIVDLVEASEGRQLLLTHTNAGVDALKKRLDRRKIKNSKYSIYTIAAFCIRWGMSFNHTAKVDVNLSPYNSKTEAHRYYEQFYYGVKQIFLHDWAGMIIQASYAGVIVDEYQDCLQVHHEMFQELGRFLPVRVLGDPLQGIFSFRNQELVNWNNLGYQNIEIDTFPWRWQNTNPDLGEYLNNVRTALWPTLSGQQCTLSIGADNDNVCIIDPKAFNIFSMLRELKQYKSVLYITKWEAQQSAFCMKSSGVFQMDEKQECDELFKFARLFSHNTGNDLILDVIDFESKCATKVNSELRSFIDKLKKNNYDFRRITKNQSFGRMIEEVRNCNNNEAILRMLLWFEQNKAFKYYRLELHREMVRSIKFAHDNNISVFEAAEHIRKDPALQIRYADYKFIASRTLLSKGLEFDCVIIDMETPLSAKEFYVAMTRAMKKIYIISSSAVLQFPSMLR